VNKAAQKKSKKQITTNKPSKISPEEKMSNKEKLENNKDKTSGKNKTRKRNDKNKPVKVKEENSSTENKKSSGLTKRSLTIIPNDKKKRSKAKKTDISKLCNFY